MNKLTQKNARFVIIGAIIACLALLPTVVTRSDTINLLILVFLFIAIAESWNLLAGYAGQINLGYAAFLGLGAMTTRMLWLSFGLALPFAVLAGGLASLLFALMVGVPTLRLKGPYFVFGTFALAEVIRIITTNALPTLSTMHGEQVATYSLVTRYYFALILAVVVVAALYLISNSRLGMGMKAVREDETAAEASGINTFRLKLAAFVFSALLAGLAGAFFAYYHVSYYYFYTFSPLWTFDAMFITYVGGLGTIIGPIIGAIFYVVTREQLALTIPIGELHPIIFGSLFISVVLLMPRGLIEPVEGFYRFLVKSIEARRQTKVATQEEK